MADSSPEGSPTPRKTPFDGGVSLARGTRKMSASFTQDLVHPTLGNDEPTSLGDGFKTINKVFDPKGKKPALLTLRPYDSDRNCSSADLDRSANPALSAATSGCFSVASGKTSSTDDFSAGPVSSSLTPSTDGYNDRGSISTTPDSEDAAQMQILTRKLNLTKLDPILDLCDKSQALSASDHEYVSAPAKGLGISTGRFDEVEEHDFAQFTPSTVFTPSSTVFTPHSADFTPAAKGPWNHVGRYDPGLMQRSIPEIGTQSTPLPQMPWNGPGVIGQPATSYRFSNMSNQYHNFQSAPYTQPIPHGHTPRSTKGGHRGKKYAWGFHHGNNYDRRSNEGYEPGPFPRAMTSAFGSLPYSMGSSSVSLPGTNSGYISPSLRSQSSYNLSATAPDFNTGSFDKFNGPSPWNDRPRDFHEQNYVNPNEPLNYRRLAEKNMTTDWKMVVDKIVCGNDQQASLFLQQKIKNGEPDQKQEIIDIIISQGVPLMANRFGNFLVQRCMEHGSPENINDIAERILGHTVNLSMDTFGCHVVQKAFDYASDRQKRIMVHELVGSVQTTIIHRYACHVWQKLFELKWDGPRPPIMRFVNDSLKGMWHEVALGETGSLVVQNIFENCPEHEKRPCIEEVLQQISAITTGQFGNWCIQHVCEHGAPPDKSRAIDHILMFATGYSQDQFGSKVVEKCLKVCGNEFLDRYLERVCAYRQDVPRMDLIDIAGDQYGNYLIQHVLQHADPTRKEIVAGHIRRHIVSLRGSKYGSRVAMLCTHAGHGTRHNHGGHAALDRAPGGAIGDAYQRTGPWGLPRQGNYRGNY